MIIVSVLNISAESGKQPLGANYFDFFKNVFRCLATIFEKSK